MTTSVFLNNDRTMPLLGLGLYKTTDAVEAEDAIAAAVQNGYRLLDTASAYKNEEFVGCGIAKCGVPRKDLFITTKIWNNGHSLRKTSVRWPMTLCPFPFSARPSASVTSSFDFTILLPPFQYLRMILAELLRFYHICASSSPIISLLHS